ncbi:hypothetical protein HMN09_01155500 [Mycena chlorophos]|uniref:Uncharacterized protein n=1 Tax=Mycena chlorophos TaxID=658473 RepID=A0A8H6VUC7_MYCCL|nr:hypothetical protein HMN09_01155500 [Mycena chlorophos]
MFSALQSFLFGNGAPKHPSVCIAIAQDTGDPKDLDRCASVLHIIPEDGSLEQYTWFRFDGRVSLPRARELRREQLGTISIPADAESAFVQDKFLGEVYAVAHNGHKEIRSAALETIARWKVYDNPALPFQTHSILFLDIERKSAGEIYGSPRSIMPMSM